MAGTRLYVGNLSFNTTEDTLRRSFEQNGQKVVEVKIVTDRDTGQPRGFAFVEMASAADAQAVMSAWDGQQLDGRSLKVNEAQERQGGGGGGGRGGGGGGRGGGRGGRGGY
jgi:cold-inducible RNA-binding protein